MKLSPFSVFFGWLLLSVNAAAAPPPPTLELLSAADEDVFGPRISSDRNEILYEALTPDGRFVRRLGPKRKPMAVPSSDLAARSADFIGPRKLLLGALTAEGRWAIEVDGKEPASPSSASDLQATVSPDGRWIAFVSGRSGSGDVYITPSDKTNAAPKRLSDGALPEYGPAWAPDGQSLAFVRTTGLGRSLVVVTGFAAGGTLIESVVVDERVAPLYASFRPDGKVIAFYARNWSSETTLYTVPVTGGPSTAVIKGVSPQATGPTWLPGKTGSWLLAVRTNDTVVAVDAMGNLKTLETGTFGHGELAAGRSGGDRIVLLTALGTTAANPSGAPVSLGRAGLYRWLVPASID